MGNIYFDINMKMADLIKVNYNIVLTLSRLNINLGFGEKKVKDVCEQHNVSPQFFILICNVYSFDTFRVEEDTIKTTDFSLLVPYLSSSHTYYTTKRLPHIKKHLNDIDDNMDSKYSNIILKFFEDYVEQILDHFTYEEKKIFPDIIKLQNGEKVSLGKLTTISKNHKSIDDKLDDFTQIIYKYLPETVLPDELFEVLFDLLQFSNDIKKHTLIEEKILTPYIKYLNNNKTL